MEKGYRHLFGPVPSRRLGRSLGIDLTPEKTCSFDCVYCQLGRTSRRTTERLAYAPTAEVLEELDRWIVADGHADAVTLAGSGEPTLHPDFGKILTAIREKTSIPSVLLTNGSLFGLPEVRHAARLASIVKVTFSAPDEATWKRLHRPAERLRFPDALEGLRLFRKDYDGQLQLEIMVVKGVNDSLNQAKALAQMAARVAPDAVQINTPVRPPTEPWARALSPERLEELARLFNPPAEVIGGYSAPAADRGDSLDEAVASLVRRHPATPSQVAEGFGVSQDKAAACLKRLTQTGRARPLERDGTTFFTAPEDSGSL